MEKRTHKMFWCWWKGVDCAIEDSTLRPLAFLHCSVPFAEVADPYCHYLQSKDAPEARCLRLGNPEMSTSVS